jgi:NAD(P)-dependent dehydrogenase (short-subunit alcohol dehydrogenase family)
LLDGRRAVVTGAARGIGLGIARGLAAHGCEVALLDRDPHEVSAAATSVAEETGARTVGLSVDVTDPAALGAGADEVESQLGPVDVVVPNAGILVLKPALDIASSELESLLRVNVLGGFHTATEFCRRMVESRSGGSVIFTSSLFGTRGGAGNAGYSASKFAIIGLAQSLAAEMAPHSIRVNTVCPGQIESAMIQQLFDARAQAAGTTSDQERADFVRRIPLGRLGDAAEVADTYVYFASHLSRYVTGQHLVVDGGWSVGPA